MTFIKVVVWDGVDELIFEDGLHGNGGVTSFFSVCVCGFQFCSMGSTGYIGNGWVWSRVSRDDKMMAIVSKVEVIMHCEAKVSLLSTAVWAWDSQGVLVYLLLYYLHSSIDWLIRTCH